MTSQQHPGWIEVVDFDRMSPFLMSVVSPSDHWMYASSSGGLAAGRVDAEGSLFPYLTDDRLHRAHNDQGPWTCFQVQQPDGQRVIWEPFRPRNNGQLRRNLRKSVAGDQLVFEETHLRLGLTFSYRWAFSERYGFVRTATLTRSGGEGPLDLRVVDGLQGLLPANAPLQLVQTASNLVNAYSRSEWIPSHQLALFNLEALPSDSAQPAESLRATVAWCEGLPDGVVLLSRAQLNDVARGATPSAETLVKGRPGAFLVSAQLQLPPDGAHSWHIVTDVARSHGQIGALRHRQASIDDEVQATTDALDGILADVDGLQRTADPTLDAHHRANALFNTMRGGLPIDEHRVSVDRFSALVATRNRACRARNADWFAARSGQHLERAELVAQTAHDLDLSRLASELLPLWFGRRHGDPSRPWNRFNIRLRDAQGQRLMAWEGNWRDIFQNWEALLLAYPDFIESAVFAFVNASTRDGYNPYRITSEGVDWEQPDADDPWANIGYWGDHQISYLTRLLELSVRYHPGLLSTFMDQARFSTADVPYRIKAYASLLDNPRESIDFDWPAQRAIDQRVAALGSDGRLVQSGDGVLHVTLTEKLLVPVLAKLCNLVPGAGIWLNTQRPEWNDANNALAGFGLSVVTAAYLRRHVVVLLGLLDGLHGELGLTRACAIWTDAVGSVLHAPPPNDSAGRRQTLDTLGLISQDYRTQVYRGDGVARTTRTCAQLKALLRRAQVWLEHTLQAARREDGLFDGYDLLRLGEGTAHVDRLYPMLEGQVAMLASGVLDAGQAADLMERMLQGPLFRPDIDSFQLYPDRQLSGFLDKNQVPETATAQPLVKALLERGDTRLITPDPDGVLRFAADLHDAEDLEARLTLLQASPQDIQDIEALWEATFNHHAFTGRSGTMYGFEGLGSVYWHMVGKLLLALQEVPGDDPRLAPLYRRVRDGLGWRRSPQDHGAIPTDPHSHTPAGRGAQQPGMTGVVKEELVARRAELGVVVEQGRLRFDAARIEPLELLSAPASWQIPAGVRPGQVVDVPAGGLAFLLCAVPVVVQPGDQVLAEVHLTDRVLRFKQAHLDAATTALVFRRDPAVQRIVVHRPPQPKAQR